MIICGDTHEEVVSEGRDCVACLMKAHYEERIDELNQEIKAMEETAEGYQERIEILQGDIEELQQAKEPINA